MHLKDGRRWVEDTPPIMLPSAECTLVIISRGGRALH